MINFLIFFQKWIQEEHAKRPSVKKEKPCDRKGGMNQRIYWKYLTAGTLEVPINQSKFKHSVPYRCFSAESSGLQEVQQVSLL